jgi:hypothetical protein
MRYDCPNLGFHFEMNDNNFIPLSKEDKIALFNMDEQQLKQNLFFFMEVKDKKFTRRYFQIVLDDGFYPTLEDVKKGQDLCRDNVQSFAPQFKLIAETDTIPQNIKNCVWKRPDGTILSQYYMAKNGYMFCVAGDISKQNDSLDNLMASVCMSTEENIKTDKQNLQDLMKEVTAEANRLALTGVPTNKAIVMVFKKFGTKIK